MCYYNVTLFKLNKFMLSGGYTAEENKLQPIHQPANLSVTLLLVGL